MPELSARQVIKYERAARARQGKVCFRGICTDFLRNRRMVTICLWYRGDRVGAMFKTKDYG
jgi:hypothetical protein